MSFQRLMWEAERMAYNLDWINEEPGIVNEINSPPVFHYTNLWRLPSLTAATVNNDVRQMKLFLASGKSVNIKDHHGNTPLHVAVIKERKDAFNLLLNVDGIQLELQNYGRATPLALALLVSNDYFAKELINKGVSVHLGIAKDGNTLLHDAINRKRKALALCLIENGANINATNSYGETPLMLACISGFDEVVCMLLYYGADVSIRSSTGHIALFFYLEHGREAVEYALLETTFDDKATVSLDILCKAMVARSSYFPRLLDKTEKIQYNSKSLHSFNDALKKISPEYFELFITKFPHVVKKMMTSYCPFMSLLSSQSVNSAPHKILTILCEHGFGPNLFDNFLSSVSVIAKLLLRHSYVQTPWRELEGTIFCLLSYGLPIHSNDFLIIYKISGYSSLFKLMLHLDHNFATVSNLDEKRITMCSMIVDYTMTFRNFLDSPNNYVQPSILEDLLPYSCAPKLKAICSSLNNDYLNKKVAALPRVPSLLELARDSFRESLAVRLYEPKQLRVYDYCQLTNCNKFYTIIQNLQIPDVCKKVLTYEKRLFEFN